MVNGNRHTVLKGAMMGDGAGVKAMERRLLLVLGSCLLAGSLVMSAMPGRAADTSGAETTNRDVIEQRIRALEGQLVAPCCWAQPVSEHRSGASSEVRGEIRRMVGEGMSDDVVRAAFVAQYGKRILAQPPADGFDVLVYVLPPAFFLLGALVLRVVHRRLSARRDTVNGSQQVEAAGHSEATGQQGDAMASRIERELAERE